VGYQRGSGTCMRVGHGWMTRAARTITLTFQVGLVLGDDSHIDRLRIARQGAVLMNGISVFSITIY
jgi:hypothetical protein